MHAIACISYESLDKAIFEDRNRLSRRNDADVPEERIRQAYPLDPVARAARAVLDDPEVLRVQRRISLDVLVDKSTLRSRRADPSSVAERRRPAEFDRNDREGVDPELAAVF